MKQAAATTVQYPTLPEDMSNFMTNIPETSDLVDIYNYLASQSLDYNTQKTLDLAQNESTICNLAV